jgi:retron-type reverse transcriptase
MKRWNIAEMVSIGRKLFAKIHKQKHHANHNHDVHFMARELDSWLVQGVQSMVDGSYTPRHLKRHYFPDEMVDQLHLSDRILQNILLKQLKPTFPYVMNPNCYHLQGPSGVRVATQRIRQVLLDQKPKYIIRADIKSFYKSIPHYQLVQDIKQHYDDEKVQAMLEQIIINPIETPRGYKNPDHGIALRGPLSQFFSGIYLKPLDDAFDTMDVTYLRYQDDVLVLCKTKRQLNRCKQRMMDVLHDRRLSLSRKKTRIGHIDVGFHFLGIHYPGTQTQDNTNVTQANDGKVTPIKTAHYLTSLGGGRQMLQLTIKRLRWIASSHIQGRCGKHASRLNKWLLMGYLPTESAVT